MIRYALICEHAHEFEGWFGSSADFDDQQARGLLECPLCASQAVRKQIMAPAVSGTKRTAQEEKRPTQAMMLEAMGALLTGKSAGVGLHSGVLYRIPYSSMIGRGFSVVVVGAADGLLQVYTDRLRDRTSAITGLSDFHVQARVDGLPRAVPLVSPRRGE